MTTCKKLVNAIMEYWSFCVEKSSAADRKVNLIIEEHALACDIDMQKLDGDVYVTVTNMTNSQKRALLAKLCVRSKEN